MRDRYLFVQSLEGVCREREEAGRNDDVRGLNVAVLSSYTACLVLLLLEAPGFTPQWWF